MDFLNSNIFSPIDDCRIHCCNIYLIEGEGEAETETEDVTVKVKVRVTVRVREE